MTSEERNILITQFRKEVEDLTTDLVKQMFNAQYGEEALIEGEISVVIPTPFVSVNDYEVFIYSAYDTDGTEIKEALTITKTSISGFKISSPRPGTVRWEVTRRIPQYNFWTE